MCSHLHHLPRILTAAASATPASGRCVLYERGAEAVPRPQGRNTLAYKATMLIHRAPGAQLSMVLHANTTCRPLQQLNWLQLTQCTAPKSSGGRRIVMRNMHRAQSLQGRQCSRHARYANMTYQEHLSTKFSSTVNSHTHSPNHMCTTKAMGTLQEPTLAILSLL